MKGKIFLVALCMLSMDLFAQGLTIPSGTFLTVSDANIVVNDAAFTNNGSFSANNSNLVLNNSSFTNNGTFSAGTGTVSFTGSVPSANSFIAGTSNTIFNNLKLDKTANGIQVNRNIEVTGTVDLVNGSGISLGGNVLDLGTTGSISGEVNTRRISYTSGYIKATATLNAPSGVNPGNIGLEITSTSNLGSTVIKRGLPQQPQSVSLIDRYFQITPTTAPSSSTQLKFTYFDAEVQAPLTESHLQFYSSVNGSSWSEQGGNNSDQTLNYVVKTAITPSGYFSLGPSLYPLPVHFISVTAALQNGKPIIHWVVNEMVNHDHFEIQRSYESQPFKTIGYTNNDPVTSSAVKSYNFIDKDWNGGTCFYRIRQVDKDGKFSFSNVVSVNGSSTFPIRLFPNPAKEKLSVAFQSYIEQESSIKIFDNSGRLVYVQAIYCQKGSNEIDLFITNFKSGQYFLLLNGLTLPFIKE